MMCFKKKTPREWTFGEQPVVHWIVSNKVKQDMLTFCKIALTQILKIENVELVVVTNDKMISRFDSSDIEMQAILQGVPEEHRYRLTLHSRISPSMIPVIVCHELIHLKQYEKGELRIVEGGAKWNGKFYEKDTPYAKRPWEIEANADMYKLERQINKLYYEK